MVFIERDYENILELLYPFYYSKFIFRRYLWDVVSYNDFQETSRVGEMQKGIFADI